MERHPDSEGAAQNPTLQATPLTTCIVSDPSRICSALSPKSASIGDDENSEMSCYEGEYWSDAMHCAREGCDCPCARVMPHSTGNKLCPTHDADFELNTMWSDANCSICPDVMTPMCDVCGDM